MGGKACTTLEVRRGWGGGRREEAGGGGEGGRKDGGETLTLLEE